MFTKKDVIIISHLRNDARKKISKISEQINIPITTVYDKVRAHEKRFVKKYVTLLDFSKLGFMSSAHLALKIEKNSRDALQKYLLEMPNINTLYRINFGCDFLAEGIFRNSAELQDFTELIEEKFHANEIHVFNTIEELKKEEFLSKKEHFELI